MRVDGHLYDPARSQTSIVVSQPMYFPWLGMFEQIRCGDVYVHYEDVQYSKGSFCNRVQVKTQNGPKWLTIPLLSPFGKNIDEIQVDETKQWRNSHLAMLHQNYRKAPFYNDLFIVLESVLLDGDSSLSSICKRGIEVMSSYFELTPIFLSSTEVPHASKGVERLLDIITKCDGSVYITGHGARNYLDFERLETAGIHTRFLDYACVPYPQFHGEFTPYVTSLDAIAHLGKRSIELIKGETVGWREFLIAR